MQAPAAAPAAAAAVPAAAPTPAKPSAPAPAVEPTPAAAAASREDAAALAAIPDAVEEKEDDKPKGLSECEGHRTAGRGATADDRRHGAEAPKL